MSTEQKELTISDRFAFFWEPNPKGLPVPDNDSQEEDHEYLCRLSERVFTGPDRVSGVIPPKVDREDGLRVSFDFLAKIHDKCNEIRTDSIYPTYESIELVLRAFARVAIGDMTNLQLQFPDTE